MSLDYLRDHDVKLGVSACLLGQRVRYDGGDKRHDWLVDVLGGVVTWVPVCPEVEIELGVPRPPIKLVRDPEPAPDAHTTNPRARLPGGQQVHLQQVYLIDTRDGRDLSADMRAFARRRVAGLADLGIAGYVLKSKSPSCGIDDVKVFADPSHDAELDRSGQGLFAAALICDMPGLPLVDERALDSSAARQAFVDRVCAYHRRLPPS